VSGTESGKLQHGWVIANHILVSFHVAFISSVLALPSDSLFKGEVLGFIFASPETVVSAAFMYASFHCGVALHEMGHFVTAARLNALNEAILEDVQREIRKPLPARMGFYARQFLLVPYGRAVGVKREGLNYYADAPYNLAVAAAGPRASRNVALLALPPALILLAVGLLLDVPLSIYAGRLLLGIGVVTLLDFLLADPGKYAEFREREAEARKQSSAVEKITGWLAYAPKMKARMLAGRIQETVHPRLGPVTAPWQYRNCGMGGRHTEKEYPESNVSMQEAMFLILSAPDYQEAQEMTVRLQNRLKDLIEKEEGCRVMGIGLEGGLAPYIDRGSYPLPEVRLWAMMKQTIAECGYRPGIDVAIALDPALNELETAYRAEHNVPDAVGLYLFWRDKTKIVLDRDGVLDIYLKAIEEYDIPILSIEDGFSEFDAEGWRRLLDRLGDRIFVIGDDLVTTNDRTIEVSAGEGLINSALIKANQIGTLYETLLAMLVALGKGLELVVSHRSKSPNDDMEAHIALAANALGLKAGGGANTERLFKYQSVTELLLKVAEVRTGGALHEGDQALIEKVRAYEEPTNAGIPTVGVTVEVSVPSAGIGMKFRGSTPLGTSAGTGEAIHLVDAMSEIAIHREVIGQHATLFREVEPGVYAFEDGVDEARVAAEEDDNLTALFHRARRYRGKGCLNAVDNVTEIIAPYFEGRNVATLTLRDTDRGLLRLELRAARRRGKLADDAGEEEILRVLQRKQNLGMNAILSVSLALGRAIAQMQGKELYELLREEMMTIVERLSNQHGVSVTGSRFADYVAALREVNAILEREGTPLYAALRKLTQLYADAEVAPAERAAVEAAPTPPTAIAPEPVTREAAPDVAVRIDDEQAVRIAALNRELHRGLVTGESADVREALFSYLEAKSILAPQVGRFGIVNNRVFVEGEALLVPYIVGDDLLLQVVRDGETKTIGSHRLPYGKIFTDALVTELADFVGAPVDLEDDLFQLRTDRVEEIRLGRIRDLTALLQRVNESTNRNEAVYELRFLVARLCNLPVDTFLRAKNLQPEVNSLTAELTRFLNSRLCRRVPLLTRIMVRNLSSLIGKPNLIDRLWNDTIDLSEIHIRGSSVVNELRRSTHHALGIRTLRIALGYREYLRNEDPEPIQRLGFSFPSPADIEARGRIATQEIVERVARDLQTLLGTSEVVSRIQDWQKSYTDGLLRCEFGHSLHEELRTLVNKGIRAENRWAYQHHLRILQRKAEDFPDASGEAFRKEIDALPSPMPGEPGFDAKQVTRAVGDAVDAFAADILMANQSELFQSLESVLHAYRHRAFYETFTEVHALRGVVRESILRGGFPAQRYYLNQLDCLLEEMGYLACRHVATAYGERGVDLDECFEIIRLSVLNMGHDGLFSRELHDLAQMLVNPEKNDAERLNILDCIERYYHKIRQRVIVPYERMRELLGMDAEELRAALANLQRYLHDLGSMVTFTDIAGAHIRNQMAEGTSRAPSPPTLVGGSSPYQILHISHREDISAIVTDGVDAPNLRDLYGGKGSGLLYISYQNIPTRDGFILPTTLARLGLHRGDRGRLAEQVAEHLRILEDDLAAITGVRQTYGRGPKPLLLAVRGGSVFTMPGILSTVVFVGMNDEIAEALTEDGPWYAWDSYRRFLASYAESVFGLDMEAYGLVEQTKKRYGAAFKKDLPWEAMREVAQATKTVLRQKGFGEQLDAILNDPMEQLLRAVEAVYESWNTPRARRYREIKGMCHTWHSAAIVQEMAFGNRVNEPIELGMDETRASLTGVIPRTRATEQGLREFAGEVKFSAAGDDLVGGVTGSHSFRQVEELRTLTPMLERRLKHTVAKLRRFMGMDQEVEFTVERGVLSVLQARTAESVADQATNRFADPGTPAALGIGVRGGGFRGLVAFDDEDRTELAALDLSERDDVDGVLMVLENPIPDEIPMIISADGLLTAKGGSTSHAAVAVNGVEDRDFYGVMSASGLRVFAKKHLAVIDDAEGRTVHRIHKGDILSIHGTSGEVYVGTRAVDTGDQPNDDGADGDES
jgi:enolase/phosphohistidine swiveling domain-containing protein